MAKSFIFPFIGLLADLAILHYNQVYTWALITAIVVFLASCYWLYDNVVNDTDNQFWPSALATIAPIFILGIGLV